MKKRILALGSCNIDFVMKTSRFATTGETVVSDGAYAFVAGGRGANYAVCASRLGADLVLCTRIGNDSFGAQLVEKYRTEGIDTRFIAKDKVEKTGLCVICAQEGGRSSTTFFRGANKNLDETDIENAFTCYPDALILSLEYGVEKTLFTANLAKEKNALIFIDACPAADEFPFEDLPDIEIFCVNETQSKLLTGIAPTSSANCLRVCVDIMNRINCRYIVLKLGERGCFIYDGTHCHHIAPVESGTVVDKTGTGDAFTSALTYRYMENSKNIIDACEFANSVCAYSVGKPGGLSSFPTAKQLEEFLSEDKDNV